MYSNKHFLEFHAQNGGENQLACIDRERNYVTVTPLSGNIQQNIALKYR